MAGRAAAAAESSSTFFTTEVIIVIVVVSIIAVVGFAVWWLSKRGKQQGQRHSEPERSAESSHGVEMQPPQTDPQSAAAAAIQRAKEAAWAADRAAGSAVQTWSDADWERKKAKFTAPAEI